MNHYPLDKYISYNNLSTAHRLFNLNITHVKEPSSYASAITNPHWKQAIEFELKYLNTTSTWDVTPLPPTKKPLDVN